ncbi:hypothetical protein E3E36_05605 [Thermococcus sp. M36]|uniref:hypothetical protein n=1 Tax=Thermococcus sp. M36 TaxID=1638261 RepID=UPI00143A8B37|nr:hypothetical protein [Thermococcus sp. M36]NJE05626.1 hypothetical protein [Thermococcus sp. M36]
MDEDLKVLRDYLLFTVPHVTVLAGAVFGILLVLGIPVVTALGVFMVFYSLMLIVLGLIIRPHVSGMLWYQLLMLLFAVLLAGGLFILLAGDRVYM